MIKSKNSDNELNDVSINKLNPDDINHYLEISLEAFFEKLKFVFSSREEAAFYIIREEIFRNIDNGRYYAAISAGKIIGVIELVTRESLKNYIRNFHTYVKYLGFLKACKAFTLSSFDIPKLNPDTVYIDNLAVENSHQRKGVGLKMLSFAEEFARRTGKNILKLWVAEKNKKAYNLYKKFGFIDMTKKSSRILEKYTGYRGWIYMKKEIS